MKRKCDICGLEDHEDWMYYYNAGSTRIWICAKCKRLAIREVNASEALNKKTRRKEKEKR